MPTIQVREIPDDAYDTIRRRARAEGKSLQAYMREQVIAFARRPTKREAMESLEAALERYGSASTSATVVSNDVRADRR